MNIVSIIEARMNSKRLPGKVLLPAQKISMLEHLVERLKTIKIIDQIVVATTVNSKDDEIVELCQKKEINFFRGSEEDVMGRVICAAEKYFADLIVEITADCPLIDPNIVDQIISIYLANKVDYVSNAIIRSYPDGMDTQVFSLKTLKTSYEMINSDLEKEHVTLHIRNNPNLFSHINVIAPKNIYYPELGLTLDEKDDYILIKKIIDNLYPKDNFFSCLDIINYLNENKILLEINKNVMRKNNN